MVPKPKKEAPTLQGDYDSVRAANEYLKLHPDDKSWDVRFPGSLAAATRVGHWTNHHGWFNGGLFDSYQKEALALIDYWRTQRQQNQDHTTAVPSRTAATPARSVPQLSDAVYAGIEASIEQLPPEQHTSPFYLVALVGETVPQGGVIPYATRDALVTAARGLNLTNGRRHFVLEYNVKDGAYEAPVPLESILRNPGLRLAPR